MDGNYQESIIKRGNQRNKHQMGKDWKKAFRYNIFTLLNIQELKKENRERKNERERERYYYISHVRIITTTCQNITTLFIFLFFQVLPNSIKKNLVL